MSKNQTLLKLGLANIPDIISSSVSADSQISDLHKIEEVKNRWFFTSTSMTLARAQAHIPN